MQTRNPLNFYCAPNQATPDYIAYSNFHNWLAYGLVTCWLSHTNNPNDDCNFPRPWTEDDVEELRDNFLSLVETVITALWKGEYSPGDGSVDGDWKAVIVDDDEGNGDNLVTLTWYIRLDDDAMMFELDCTGSDSTAIWLNYDAIEDRTKVIAALTEARKTLNPHNNGVWDELLALEHSQPA